MTRVHTPSTTVFRPMTRNLLLLCTVLLAACGEAPTVSVFTVAPGTIAKGTSATLVFAAEGEDKLTLEPGAVDVTGKSEVEVSPGETTTYTLTASNRSGNTLKTLTLSVGPTPAAGFKLTAAGIFTAGTPANVTVTAVDPSGAPVPSYTGTVHLVSNDGAAELPADFTFTAADNGVKTVPVTFRTAGARQLVASGTVGGGMVGSFSTTSEPFTVKAGPAARMNLSGLAPETESGAEVSFQVSFVDAFGNLARDYATQLHIQHSDESAPAVPDLMIDAKDGTATIRLALFKAGVQTITVQDTHNDEVKVSSEIRVRPSRAVSYAISGLPTAARVGEPLALTVTALDAKGNRAAAYSGKVRFSSTDTAMELPADASFSQGVALASVGFRTQGDQTVTATEVGGSLTATTGSVKVTSTETAARLVLSGTGPTAAGAAASFTVTVMDVFGNTLTGYKGTVRFSSTDPLAALPSTYTFTETDAGTRTFFASLQTVGLQTLTVVDNARGELKASGAFSVAPAAASACEISEVPATTIAGTPLTVRVTARDMFGNVVTHYNGTITLTATDAQASLPAPTAYTPGKDQGSRVFGARLVRAGGQTITATDTTGGWSCTASVTINPAATMIHVALPADTNAGYPVEAVVSVRDTYGNPISYVGSLAFSSTDTAATLPGPLTLTGSESGTSTVSATFNTVGAQRLTASLVGDSSLSGSSATAVHGFVYTDPTPGFGKVRFVVNAAASSASLVQLDLVSNTSLVITGTAATARGGVYSAGMNLPLDSTRVEADSPLLVEGNALNLGAAPKAVAASGPTAGVLYTGVSQKFDGAGKVTGDVTLLPGRVFYSVRLKLPATATVGTVFNGTSLDTRFRAAVRNRAGDEVLANADVALGKLEIR